MAATKKKPASNAVHHKKQEEPRPIRREVGAVVCLIFAVLTSLSVLGLKAAALDLFANLFRGLLGGGFYVLPFSFLTAFLILLLHDGRPVALRVICAFLTALLVGSIVQLFAGKDITKWSFAMLKTLWQAGLKGKGGVLSGLLALGLKVLISSVGAAIAIIIGLLLSVITSLNMTVTGIIRAIRSRPRPAYAEPQREHRDPAKVIVDHVANQHIERVERRAAAGVRVSDFDLPVDDPPMAEPQPRQPETKAQKGMRPDEYIESSRKQARQEAASLQEPMPEPEPEEAPDILAVREPRMVAEVIPMEQHPKKFPPLVIDHYDDVTEEEEPEKIGSEPEEVIIPQLPKEKKPVAPEPVIEDPVKAEPAMKKEQVLEQAAAIEQEIQAKDSETEYVFPPTDLLLGNIGKQADGTEEMRQNTDRLNDTLQSFGIEARIIDVIRGPSVTRYEMELARGVKLSKVTNLADDIALALGSTGVRIAAIPDKISVVGIEVPNRQVTTVRAREVIDSSAFVSGKSKISFAVGKDIGGNCIVGDIGKLPHMLIAGTTGSGKSVCMNSLIISLLYKAKPEEVKLIMVDPKMVELGIYNAIPHLLIPVVTDPKKAAGALQWAVTEMMKRYRAMADAGVRDLDSYNKLARSRSDDDLHPMPQIVVVIDELADLMLVAAKEVEESICRIAQMGRASGIHLVIATQRPSADVITGLMKANIPSRIAFAVASAMESRIILDTAGAEKLVGKGDMLYAPLGQGKPKRVQGCFITDEEVQRVVDFVKQSNKADYDNSVMDEIDQKAAETGKSGGNPSASEPETDDGDEMLPNAVEILLETGQASVSMLQRRLKLGFSRAARIMDEMEERGIVGPYEGSKPRQLLITREQWKAMQGGTVPEPVEEEIP